MDNEMLELLLDMINEENELIAEYNGEVHYIGLNDLNDNEKTFIYINTDSEKVTYFDKGDDIINKFKNKDLDFKEQKKGKDI